MHILRLGGVTALLLAAACADRGDHPSDPLSGDAGLTARLTQDQLRYERLARRVALAMNDDTFRASVHGAVQTSRFRERKVHLQRFLPKGGSLRERLAVLTGDGLEVIGFDIDGQRDIELYLPVDAHRARWTGDRDVLVATALRDGDAPVAFDLQGRRRRLDPDTPPDTPVLMVAQAEAGFDRPQAIDCIVECGGEEGGGGGGGGTGGGANLTSPGLYLTQTSFNGTFEGWFKGDPEFEVHLLGQAGQTDTLKSLQCAGAEAGGPFAFDQNDKTWSGRVLLASQTQLDQYRAQHPGQAYRLLVVEDDDGACQIKVNRGRFEQMVTQLEATYQGLAGGKDSVFSITRTWTKARSLQKMFTAVWSWITTQDELPGMIIEDVSASSWIQGSKWIVRGENSKVNGAVKLDFVGTQ